jgi:hypothetical protein
MDNNDQTPDDCFNKRIQFGMNLFIKNLKRFVKSLNETFDDSVVFEKDLDGLSLKEKKGLLLQFMLSYNPDFLSSASLLDLDYNPFKGFINFNISKLYSEGGPATQQAIKDHFNGLDKISKSTCDTTAWNEINNAKSESKGTTNTVETLYSTFLSSLSSIGGDTTTTTTTKNEVVKQIKNSEMNSILQLIHKFIVNPVLRTEASTLTKEFTINFNSLVAKHPGVSKSQYIQLLIKMIKQKKDQKEQDDDTTITTDTSDTLEQDFKVIFDSLSALIIDKIDSGTITLDMIEPEMEQLKKKILPMLMTQYGNSLLKKPSNDDDKNLEDQEFPDANMVRKKLRILKKNAKGKKNAEI